MNGAGDTLELEVALDDERGARTARRAAAQTLSDWGVGPPLDDGVCLAVTELVTNALLHGRSDVVLRLRHMGAYLRVEVFDEDDRLPLLDLPEAEAANGRGLLIVASSAPVWGTERSGQGKVVWAEFPLG